MKKRVNIQGNILLALAIASLSVAWVLAESSASPLFQSPLPTPDWHQVEITPTPRPQPIILPNVTVGPATFTTGLRGYWHLDEASLGNRVDSSPSGNNTLTNINGVAWTTGGKIGNASDFESDNNQYLKIESNQAVGLNFSYSFTLVGWIKRESIGVDGMTLVSKFADGTGINNRAYRLQFASNNRLQLVVSPNGTYTSTYQTTGSTQLTSTTNWYHVAAVFDAGAKRLKLYVNGNLDANGVVTYDTVYQSTAPFILGAVSNNGVVAYEFDGLMDEWQVYTRALSQSEIQALMNE